MAMNFVDVKTLYEKDKNLKNEDVKILLDWANKQPHLPEINELQAILFLHCCYYKNEAAKTVIDNFFTLRTHCPEMFKNRNALVYKQMESCLVTILPKQTHEGYGVVFATFLDNNAENFNFQRAIRYFDMIFMLDLYANGFSNGHLLVLDFSNITFTHILKLGPLNLKKFIYYLQEAVPTRVKGFHFYKIVPFMDKVLAIIKPFMTPEFIEMLHLHNTVDSLTQFVPLECLPEELGGPVGSVAFLHDNVMKKIEENNAFFDWEENFVVDESKREEKLKNNDILGIDGTFKKLEVD